MREGQTGASSKRWEDERDEASGGGWLLLLLLVVPEAWCEWWLGGAEKGEKA